MSDRQSFEYSPMGRFEWKTNQWTETSLELFHGNGQKLAQCQLGSSLSGHDKQQLDIFVPGQEAFYDLIVVTALAAAKFHEKESKDAEEASDTIDIVSILMP